MNYDLNPSHHHHHPAPLKLQSPLYFIVLSPPLRIIAPPSHHSLSMYITAPLFYISSLSPPFTSHSFLYPSPLLYQSTPCYEVDSSRSSGEDIVGKTHRHLHGIVVDLDKTITWSESKPQSTIWGCLFYTIHLFKGRAFTHIPALVTTIKCRIPLSSVPLTKATWMDNEGGCL